MNAVPLSDIICRGFPKIFFCNSSLLTTSRVAVVFVGYNQINLQKLSITAKM